MAGMLPGVECARRRRFHQSITSSDSPSTAAKLGSTRRPYFCLYTSNRDFHVTSSSSQHRSSSNQAYQNDKLGEIAREAKERLDERLRTHRKPETLRKSSSEGVGLKGSEKKGKEKTSGKGKLEEGKGEKTKKKLSWGKLSLRVRWKASEQEECAVCLEGFRAWEPLVHLPCAHKFHSTCLVPWLQANSHCPCCRLPIASSQ